MDGNLTEKERLLIQVMSGVILMLIGIIEIRNAKKMIAEGIGLIEGTGYYVSMYPKPKNHHTKK